MRFWIISILLLFVVLVASCTSGGGGEGSVVVRSSSVDCSGSTASCKASLAACQNLNSGLIADRDLKVQERNGCIDKYNALADSVNSELNMKSEYKQVLDACYRRQSYDSSGILVSKICPSCNYKLSCDSVSMMPAFGCNSELELHKVRSEGDVKVCDVILYNRPNEIEPLIHRVWKVYNDNGVIRFKTAGDYSIQFDTYDPQFSDIIGEVAKVTTS